ncbi:fatty acid elongation related protein [Cyclospora cayetanensis]|uniref:Fatty acid elongation related protein n=1 Tax=Cyclospora cayetanensis TaxID=88456 RepID=A0A1D3D282_9EIME|nr:fatty acid elongation related protein [Cyclospora cayetanensis]
MTYKFVINSEGILHRMPPDGITTYPSQSVLILDKMFPILKPLYFDLEGYPDAIPLSPPQSPFFSPRLSHPTLEASYS